MTIAQAIFYVAFALVLLAFAGRVRGRSFTALMDEIRHEHEHIHEVMAHHPGGGTWQEVRGWMQESP